VFLADVERRAFRKAMFATGSQEDALDIVQDAMFKLVQKYKDKPPGEWPALFYRILQSRINDFYRRRAVRNRFRVFLGGGEEDQGLDPIQQLPDPRERGPDAELDSERAIDGLDVAIKGLPGRQREAFLLRVWDGLSVEQTAKAMKCSQGSVKTHYSRAVHRLREELGEHWH
jgi:RNA polymerase sigma-70 factor (ECF subfamily)